MNATLARLTRSAAKLHLPREELVRMVGTSSATVSQWLEGQEAEPLTEEALARILETQAILEALARIMTPDAARAWLFRANPLLEELSPAEALARGRHKAVLRAIDALGEGAFV